LTKLIKIKGVVQSQHNKAQIRRPIGDERTVEILALTELNFDNSLTRQEQDSGVSRDTVWRILKNNKFILTERLCINR